jgi:hypothetical protein
LRHRSCSGVIFCRFQPNEAERPFGVYHRTPVRPWIAALFIADTGAAT